MSGLSSSDPENAQLSSKLEFIKSLEQAERSFLSAFPGRKQWTGLTKPAELDQTGFRERKTYEALKLYQHEAIEFCIDKPFSGVWLDMGLGKTVSMLTLLVLLLCEGSVKRALVIAPLRVAVQTWPDEIGNWEHTAELQFTLIRPVGNEPEITAAKERAKHACRVLGLDSGHTARVVGRAETMAEERVRRQLVRIPTPLHIINRERLPWLQWYWGKNWPYDCVFFDESSGLRSHKSERFKALARARPFIKRMHLLTGTPAPETYIDLFPQTYLLDRGERFGRSITNFQKRYFHYDENRRKWEIRKGSANLIIDKLDDIVLVMRQEDYLARDKPLLIDRPVTLSDSEMAMYRSLEEEYVLSLPNGGEIEAETTGALAQKLLQLASGAMYDADKNVHFIHDHKIKELEQLVEEAQGTPILVAYGYKSTLARLKKAFPQGKQMDKAGFLQVPWNKGDLPLLFIHPKSAGHGLNLQNGPGHTLVFFDIPYPLEDYLQTIARLDRQGQARIVKVYHLWAKGTIDADVVPRLKRKESAQNYVFDRLKALRQNRKAAPSG